MAEFNLFAITICVMLSLAAGSNTGRFSASIIAINWVLWSGWTIVTGDYEAWWLGIVLDAASAWALLLHHSRRRAWLACLYCVQISMHIAYGILKAPDYDAYYNALNVLFMAQLVMVGGWSGGCWILSLWRRPAIPSREKDMDRASYKGWLHAS